MAIHIRIARPADSEACGRIIYEAFQGIAERHGFSPDFPAVETATQLAQSFIAHPSIFGVVAEEDGSVVGSNFLAEGDAIRGVGPITVDPRRQGGGIGRCLMAAVLERGSGAAGIRLLQDAFSMRSSVALCLARVRRAGAGAGDDRSAVERPRIRHNGSPHDRAGPGRLQRALRPDSRLLSRERTGGRNAASRARGERA